MLNQLGARAQELLLIAGDVTASVDATGLEDHHASPHFLRRRGRMKRYQPWLKLALVGDHRSHLLLAAVVTRGPGNDSPLLPPAVRQACARVPIRRLLGDAAFDAEPHHRLCREKLHIRRTVFPLNPRAHPGTVRGRYRQQLRHRFPQRLYGQRWQMESMISRLKRRLGYSLTARRPETKNQEALWRVVAYNCLIIAPRRGFYRAD